MGKSSVCTPIGPTLRPPATGPWLDRLHQPPGSLSFLPVPPPPASMSQPEGSFKTLNTPLALLCCFLFCKVGVIALPRPPRGLLSAAKTEKPQRHQQIHPLYKWNDCHGNTGNRGQRVVGQGACHLPLTLAHRPPRSAPCPPLAMMLQPLPSSSSFQHQGHSSRRLHTSTRLFTWLPLPACHLCSNVPLQRGLFETLAMWSAHPTATVLHK